MLPLRSVPRFVFGMLLILNVPVVATPDARLSPAQEAELKKVLPKTLAKLQRRELVRVVSIGDSISTFYQPPGFPRYDSSMAWQGRLLNRLGAYFFYHGTVDVDPHREITVSQKEAAAAWSRFESELAVWQRTKKGEAPLAPDALRFRSDLETPVAMSVPELVRRGVPAAQQIVQGAAIQILNLARDGSQAAQALEALGPEAFPPPPAAAPDLVTICYGVNDAIGGLPLAGYRAFLEEAVKICRSHGAEVLLAAPPVSFDPGSPRASLGRNRPYAQIAREVATAAGTAFVDLGAAQVLAPSDLNALTVNDAFAAAIVPVGRQFAFRSDAADTLHPNASATVEIGEAAAVQLLSGPAGIGGPVQVTGGMEFTGPAEATAILRIFNPTGAVRTVAVSPLSFTGWQVKPGTPDALFNIAPGKARRFNLPLVPLTDGPAPEAGSVRGSLIVSDDDHQQLADVVLPIQPVAVAWPEGRYDAASGDILLPATLTNQGFTAVKGTAKLIWMGKTQELPFSLEPNQKIPLPLRLALPDPATTRFRETAAVEITLPDRTMRFTRHVEGVRYLGIEQRTPLVAQEPWLAGTAPPAPDVFVTPFADSRGIYFIVEMPATGSSPKAGGTPWGSVEVQIDGRKPGENGTLGFVDRLSAVLPWADGPVALRKLRPAVFGNGYHFDYHPDGFRVSATTRPDGSRRIEFNIARVNLTQHEWSLDGSGQSTLGFNLRVNRFDPATGQVDPASTRTITASGFGGTDARSLTVLELSRTPAARWSLRVF